MKMYLFAFLSSLVTVSSGILNLQTYFSTIVNSTPILILKGKIVKGAFWGAFFGNSDLRQMLILSLFF